MNLISETEEEGDPDLPASEAEDLLAGTQFSLIRKFLQVFQLVILKFLGNGRL